MHTETDGNKYQATSHDIPRILAGATNRVSPHLRGIVPQAAVIVGSGLNDVTDSFDVLETIRYAEFPDFPRTSVAGHRGELVIVRIGETPGLIFCGRSHLYEGYAPWQLGLQVRLAHRLGVRRLISVCASGSLTDTIPGGSMVLVRDHLNLSGANPLVGVPAEAEQKFPDTTRAYDPELLERAESIAATTGIVSARGVYAWVSGPSYETAAESRMLRMLGADVVGMSLVPEVLTACQLKMRTLALACITNLAPGIGDEPPSHEQVLAMAVRFQEPLRTIIGSIVDSRD